MSSPPSYTAPAPSATSHTFFGLSLMDEFLALTAICVVLTLYFISFSYYRTRIYETQSNNNTAVAMQEREMVQIEASVFSYGKEDGIDDDGECAICLDEFKAGEKCRMMRKCGHVFHRNCIDRWLKAERHCPLCRSCVCIVVHVANPTIPSTSPLR